LLPLAISFYTFQQIAFLVDTYRGFVGWVSFLNYAVFVTFFPQLIAGPIVHHKEVMPQFASRQNLADFNRLAVALSIFTVGLFKKTVIADGLAPTANLVFAKADAGNLVSSIEAFAGTFAYSFQLYFDFSGYSDMAIGLALLFGIRLPVNFRSPYRADSIIEFWRRWHITLSRFLRDYLYIPLGGNRKGATRRATNMMTTMLLGGLWHGAGWTFVIWGGLHGASLLINQIWAGVILRHPGLRLPKSVAVGLTFVTISFFWIFFRAETVDGALNIISGMGNFDAGLMSQSQLALLLGAGVQKVYYTVGLFILAFAIVFGAPNAASYYLDGKSGFKFNPDLAHLIFVVAMWVVIILTIGDSSEFLYFQF